MSKSQFVLSFPRHLALIVCILVAVLTPSLAGAANCAQVVPLKPNSTWQDAGQAAGEASCFTVPLDDHGVLAVDVYSELDASDARLELETLDVPSRLHPASPQHFYGLVPAGDVLVRVQSVDRLASLDPFRLQVRFVAVDALGKGELDDELEAEPDPLWSPGTVDPAKGELDDELEAEPDPLTDFGQCMKDELDDELEAEPDPLWSPAAVTLAKGELDDELEAEPDPFTSTGLDWRAMSEASLCSNASGDLADDLLCARRWTPGCGEDVLVFQSELRGDWGSDQDVVRLNLQAPSTVTVQARGEVELALRLDDASGQRLDRISGDVDGIRLVRSLAAGTYYLRLAGQDGAEGSYELTVWTERH